VFGGFLYCDTFYRLIQRNLKANVCVSLPSRGHAEMSEFLGSSSITVHGHELGHLMTSHVQRIECTGFTATRNKSNLVGV